MTLIYASGGQKIDCKMDIRRVKLDMPSCCFDWSVFGDSGDQMITQKISVWLKLDMPSCCFDWSLLDDSGVQKIYAKLRACIKCVLMVTLKSVWN